MSEISILHALTASTASRRSNSDRADACEVSAGSRRCRLERKPVGERSLDALPANSARVPAEDRKADRHAARNGSTTDRDDTIVLSSPFSVGDKGRMRGP